GAIPTLKAYDPAYAYELVVIIQDGLGRMFRDQQPLFYYLTMYNETYPQPAMPEGVAQGILNGMYRLSSQEAGGRRQETAKVPQILASGPILREARRAQE